MRRLQCFVGNDHNLNAALFFDVLQRAAFFIQHKRRHFDGCLNDDLAGFFFEGFFLDQPYQRQCQRLHITDTALTTAARAEYMAGFAQ